MPNEDLPIHPGPGDPAWKDSAEIILASVVPEPDRDASELPPVRRRWKLPLTLFVLTCLTTFVAGSLGGGLSWRDFNPLDGLIYSASLMTILVCHETGHFLQARRHQVYSSYPFFLPMPLPPIGTMGAVIAMGSRIRDRKALFDIGVSGPLAGLVPALVFCVIGLRCSHPVSEQEVALAIATGHGSNLALGSSYLFSAMIQWLQPLPQGYMLNLSPMATAGWVGLLLTALNLFPISQLDGGHVLYAMVRRGQHVIANLLLMAAIVMILLFPGALKGWAIMVFLLLLMGPSHPPTADDSQPLGWGRTLVGWLTLAFLFVGFTPQPLAELDVHPMPRPRQRHNPYEIEVRLDRRPGGSMPVCHRLPQGKQCSVVASCTAADRAATSAATRQGKQCSVVASCTASAKQWHTAEERLGG